MNCNKLSLQTTCSKTKKISPTRKQNKNDVNVALKNNEFLSKCANTSVKNISPTMNGNIKVSKADVCDVENQENKRPVHNSGCGQSVTPSGRVTTSPSGSTTGSISARKSATPNKWDAVMNKIAINKNCVKTKNYSEVKSKVTCGIAKKDSPPGLVKTPPTPSSKRTCLTSSKR